MKGTADVITKTSSSSRYFHGAEPGKNTSRARGVSIWSATSASSTLSYTSRNAYYISGARDDASLGSQSQKCSTASAIAAAATTVGIENLGRTETGQRA